MLYNHESLLERYNMADTLKAQHVAFLTAGCVCYSDMGRVLCSITADSCGWHDTICGLSDAAMVSSRYGSTRFQEQRNDYYKNGRDSMLNELGKYGLGKRDLIANINFFSRIAVGDGGALEFDPRALPGRGLRRPAIRNAYAAGALDLPAPARSGSQLPSAPGATARLGDRSGTATGSVS